MDFTAPIIGLRADPGVPERVATRIADDLAEQISESSGTRWRVEIGKGELPLAPDGNIPLFARAPQLLEDHGWDYIVYLTDLPRYTDDRPMLCEMSAEARAALISLPPLGAIRVAERTQHLVTVLINAALTPLGPTHQQSGPRSTA